MLLALCAFYLGACCGAVGFAVATGPDTSDRHAP